MMRLLSRAGHCRGGFTLIELMVVMVIIGLLAVFTVPAISSLSSAGETKRAISDISLLLNRARSYAMAHNTYVWVGFASDLGAQEVTVGAVAGTTGDSDDLSLATPLTRLKTYSHLALANLNGIAGMSTSADDIADSQVGSFQQTGGGMTVNFTEVLQFSPQGEATIDKTPDGSHWIQIGLQPARGSSVSHDVAVFQVAALTGQVRVFQP